MDRLSALGVERGVGVPACRTPGQQDAADIPPTLGKTAGDEEAVSVASGAPAQALQQALMDLCKAWDAKVTSRFSAPRFKRKGEGDTLRLPQNCK